MLGHLLESSLEYEGTTRRALTHLCIIRKNGQVTHTARQVACHLENNSRGKRSPILEKRRGLTLLYQHAGTLRSEIEMERNIEVLLQLEMSPSYIPPNAEESREAPPNCTVSLSLRPFCQIPQRSSHQPNTSCILVELLKLHKSVGEEHGGPAACPLLSPLFQEPANPFLGSRGAPGLL